MSLAESLAEISQNSKRNSSPETLRIFEEAAAALVRAGIGDHALQEGDDFPSLTLRDHNSSEFEVCDRTRERAGHCGVLPWWLVPVLQPGTA